MEKNKNKYNQVLKYVITSIKKGRARQGKVIWKGFLEDVKYKILKTESNPSEQGQPESGYGPTRSGIAPVVLIVICLYREI